MSTTQSTQVQTPAAETHYHPIQSSLGLIASTSTTVYNKVTPQSVDKYLRNSDVVIAGRKRIEKAWEMFKPYVNTVDSWSSSFLEWSVLKYQELFVLRVQNVISSVKKFYSSESNDYARITLRFLTMVIPNPRFLETVAEQQFVEQFKYDPKFETEKFQVILKNFYKYASHQWKVTQSSKPTEIIKNMLLIVAMTMEEVQLESSEKIPFFAQKMSDYFMEPLLDLSRVNFRAFVKDLLQVEELSEALTFMADEYLQIAAVLFDLTNLSNKDLIDWTIRFLKTTKKSVSSAYKVAKESYDFLLKEAVRVPKEAYSFVSAHTQAVVKVGKETVISFTTKVRELQAVQYCLEQAQRLDIALRHNLESVKAILQKNEEAFLVFVSQYKKEIAEFIRESSKNLTKYSKETTEAALKVLEQQKIRALNVAELGKETFEMLHDATSQFLFSKKERLFEFFHKNSELLREETRAIGSYVFKVLRIEEINSFVCKNLRAAEEYLRIRESLSKINLLIDSNASEIMDKKMLTPEPASQ